MTLCLQNQCTRQARKIHLSFTRTPCLSHQEYDPVLKQAYSPHLTPRVQWYPKSNPVKFSFGEESKLLWERLPQYTLLYLSLPSSVVIELQFSAGHIVSRRPYFQPSWKQRWPCEKVMASETWVWIVCSQGFPYRERVSFLLPLLPSHWLAWGPGGYGRWSVETSSNHVDTINILEEVKQQKQKSISDTMEPSSSQDCLFPGCVQAMTIWSP